MSFPFSRAYGQWYLVTSFPTGTITAIEFLDEFGASNIGFVGVSNGICRTTDRGKTWTKTTFGSPVVDFTFKDKNNGWAAAILVYRTTDGGVTWTPSNLGGDIHSIYYNKFTGLLFASRPLLPAMVSSDEGQTWQTQGPKGMLGVAFIDSVHGIRTSYDSVYQYTTNGGATWTSNFFVSESW